MSGTMVDCRGLSCPQPVLRVKEELEKGAPFCVLVDAQIAVENITRFLGHKGVPYAVSERDGSSLIEVKS